MSQPTLGLRHASHLRYHEQMGRRVQLLRHHLRAIARRHRWAHLWLGREVEPRPRHGPRRERNLVGLVRVAFEDRLDRLRPVLLVGCAPRVHVVNPALF